MDLEFLDDASASVEDVQPASAEPAAEPAQEPQPEGGRPRDEQGRFAPKDPPAEPATAEPIAPAPAEPPKAEPIMVPLAALHETRDKVKVLEEQLAQFRQPQQQPQPMQAPPDPIDDPEGFQAYQQHQLLNVTLNLSEDMAAQQHGAEAVAAAQEWAKQQFRANPAMYSAFVQQRNPYGWLVQQHQRDRIASEVTESDYEQFKAWKAAQSQIAQAQPQPAPAAASPTPAPPRSIASEPSAGGLQTIATGPGVAFDDTIK